MTAFYASMIAVAAVALFFGGYVLGWRDARKSIAQQIRDADNELAPIRCECGRVITDDEWEQGDYMVTVDDCYLCKECAKDAPEASAEELAAYGYTDDAAALAPRKEAGR